MCLVLYWCAVTIERQEETGRQTHEPGLPTEEERGVLCVIIKTFFQGFYMRDAWKLRAALSE